MKVNPNKRLTSLALQPQAIENPHTPIKIFSHEYLLWATSHLRQPSLRNDTIIQQSSFLVNRHFLFFILYSSTLSLFSLFSLFYSVIYLFRFIHSILCNSGFFFCSILLFEQCYTAMFFSFIFSNSFTSGFFSILFFVLQLSFIPLPFTPFPFCLFFLSSNSLIFIPFIFHAILLHIVLLVGLSSGFNLLVFSFLMNLIDINCMLVKYKIKTDEIEKLNFK